MHAGEAYMFLDSEFQSLVCWRGVKCCKKAGVRYEAVSFNPWFVGGC